MHCSAGGNELESGRNCDVGGRYRSGRTIQLRVVLFNTTIAISLLINPITLTLCGGQIIGNRLHPETGGNEPGPEVCAVHTPEAKNQFVRRAELDCVCVRTSAD